MESRRPLDLIQIIRFMPPYQSVKFVFSSPPSRAWRAPPFLHQLKLATWDLKLETAFMRFIGNVIEKLQRHPKRVVFPEGEEPRILQAARQFSALRLGAPIVLGDHDKVKKVAADLNILLEGIRIINPLHSADLDNFAKRFFSLRRDKGVKAQEARE